MLEGVQGTNQPHSFFSVLVQMGKPRRVTQTPVMGFRDLEKQEPEDWHKLERESGVCSALTSIGEPKLGITLKGLEGTEAQRKD